MFNLCKKFVLKKNKFIYGKNLQSFFFYDYIFVKKYNKKKNYIFFKNNKYLQNIYCLKKNNFFLKKLYFNLFYEYINIFKYLFVKIKFYGKTFKWLFFKKRLKFKVQKAHKVLILFKYLQFKKKKKLKIKIRLYNFYDKYKLISILKKIKYINIFTKKGLRVLKTLFKKKRGKISSYVNKYV